MEITVPVALHLDHGTYEGCYKCIKAGFTSIMFDGSHYPIDENIKKTTELVNVAHKLLAFLLRQKLVQSAAKKMVLSEWVNVQTLMNVKLLQILV